MVRLVRAASPQFLIDNRDRWTQRWIEILAGTRNGDWATQTAKRKLSAALIPMTRGKCAYCESRLEVTSYTEIEHHIAKTVDPDSAFEWSNLFPMCRLCNGAKGDEDHEGMLLKPDVDDPQELFWLNPDTGELEPITGLDRRSQNRVLETIRLCDLKRGALCAKRLEAMDFVIHWLERTSMLLGGKLDAQLVKEWARICSPETEYKFVIRHVLLTKGEPRLASLDRTLFEG